MVLGEVEDAHQFISSKSVSIVPLFAGSGMRVKIIEAMALGRAIVSTTVGAESLSYSNGENILIADEAETFAGAIVQVLGNTSLRNALGKNAQQLILDKYDNRKICADLLEFCKPGLS